MTEDHVINLMYFETLIKSSLYYAKIPKYSTRMTSHWTVTTFWPLCIVLKDTLCHIWLKNVSDF